MNNLQERKILYDKNKNILPLVDNWHFLINDRWECQKKAYRKIRRYLKNKDNTKFSMLIKMPTGRKQGDGSLFDNFLLTL